MNFVFRPSTRPGRHPGSLSLRIIHRRRIKTVTLGGCRLYPEEWDKHGRSLVYPENDPSRRRYLEGIGRRMDREAERFRDFVLLLEQEGRYGVNDIAECYRRKNDDGKLLGYAEMLAGDLERRGQFRTANAYRTVSRGLVRFNRGKDIPLNRINACLVKDFEADLRDKGRLPNTVSYYMRNLRAIYNKAAESNRIAGQQAGERPFAGVYTGVTRTSKRALTLEEARQLHDTGFSLPGDGAEAGTREWRTAENLRRAWLMFFFCLYARGMSFIDMAYLRKENIRGGMIRYCRKKTGQQIEVRLTRELKEIIDSFSGETAGSPYVFPVIRENGKKPRLQYESALRGQNRRLKALSSLAGIKPVSTHMSRHTWATIGKQENVPLRVISECLGHTSETTTLIYLGLLDNSVLDAANEVIVSAIARQSAVPATAI